MFNKVQKILLVAVVCSTLVVLAIVLVLIWTMPDLPKTVITDEICLPDQSGNLICKDTEQRLYEYTNTRIDAHLKQLNQEYENYVKDVNSANNIELKNFVEERYFDRKPAARVVMSDPYRRKRDTGLSSANSTMFTIRPWETGKDLRDYGGFLRFGMRCSDGRIMVPLTGTYAVSSYVDMSSKPGKKGQSLRHALYKYNIRENHEEELVSNLQPKQYCTRKNTNEQSSFLNTIVKLTSGEELLVKVSDNANLPEHQQNYLAVYLI